MWLERLKKIQDAPGSKVEKVEKAPFSTSSTSCPGAFPEKTDLSETVADEVCQAIPTASEQDLEDLHDRPLRTRATAAPNGNTERVYVSDLLAIPNDDGNICYCCGRSEWSENAGRRICAVCHPNPDQPEEVPDAT